jgi:hypothetical protein
MQFGFDICPYCNSPQGFDYVHGHYQCKVCKQNVMPCCGGEQETQEDNEPISSKQSSAEDNIQ